ncbi:MAG: trypsin-like peptidase domain-containing protein [Cyanobacteria bacterium SID2]|nr:trypsin-like peptidase domain-containing protein [Cyanobacteria bacterium SID2]MBP0002861.1 trypsin-like peptidase domain-containing protein [Cyanobacteria bacterium SBC]
MTIERLRLTQTLGAITVGVWASLLLSESAIALGIVPQESESAPLCQVSAKPIASDLHPVEQVARSTTVRIIAGRTAGSGVVIARSGNTYTAITNWHVLSYGRPEILTPDRQRHALLGNAIQIDRADLAVVRFQSSQSYTVATIATEPVMEGDVVYASGFPMYGRSGTTLNAGVDGLQFTAGRVSLLLDRSLSDGYRLGYTNAIEVGMSGGPIFNAEGKLVGINGRTAGRDPGFGAYVYQDGTAPPNELLNLMIASSWGIPISVETLARYPN